MDRSRTYKEAYRAGWNDAIDEVLRFLNKGVTNEAEREHHDLLGFALNSLKIDPTEKKA